MARDKFPELDAQIVDREVNEFYKAREAELEVLKEKPIIVESTA